MEALREVTEWNSDVQPNHVYLLDGLNILAYIPNESNKAFYFKKPIPFDKRGRKFETVKPNPFKATSNPYTIEVKGSKGQSYFIDTVLKTCTCPGYQFRSQCKHLDEALK